MIPRREGSANPAAFAGGRVSRWIWADPTFIDRLTGALITRVARNPQAVLGAIVERRVDEKHAEGDEITGLILGRHPPPAEFIAENRRIVGQRAREGPPEAFGAGL